MKKFLTILSFICFILTSAPAKADLVLGADVYKTFLDTSQEFDTYTENNYDMIAAVLGFDFMGVGIEGFYQMSEDVANNKNHNSKLQSFGADFVIRFKTSEYLDFVTSLGYIKYKLETELRDLQSDGLRIGMGFQFNFNKHLAIRTMYHYSALTKEIDHVKSINEISAGIRLKF